jgi:FdrA protein
MGADELSTEFTASLGEAAAAAALEVGAAPAEPDQQGELRSGSGAIRGLFSGGTLRDEARAVILDAVPAVVEELPAEQSQAHVLVDLGDERYTEGRAHPMIDPTLRISMLKDQGADPAVGVLLLDVVLGYGAHPDPATAIAPAIEAALSRRGDSLNVVVFLCGTKGDHQGLEAQADRLLEAGAVVTRSNAHAARLALEGAGLGEERS